MAEAAAAGPILAYDRVAANHRATRQLLTLFGVLTVPFVAGLIPLLAPAVYFALLEPAAGETALARLHATGGGAVAAFATSATLAVFVVLLVSAALVWLEVRQASRLVLRITGARPVRRDEATDLSRVVENLSLAAGLPAPATYVVESRDPNAFAVGLDPERSTVVVTRGLLQLLDRRELEGVIAHELSHIANHDTRLGTLLAGVLAVLRLPLALLRLLGFRSPALIKVCLVLSGFMAVVAGLAVLAIASQVGVALWLFPGEVREFVAAAAGRNALLVAMVGAMIFYGPLAMGSPFYVLFGAHVCGRRVGAAVSRRREFLADADAVLLTRDPEGLALALMTVGAAASGAGGPSSATAHLFFVQPPMSETGWWDRGVVAHPSIESRIDVLARMGSGISPRALEEARARGERYRGEGPSRRQAADADHGRHDREASCSSEP